MKRIDEPCEVKTRPDRPVPYLFQWRGDTWKVQRISEVWRLESRWWVKNGPERRTYYRCRAHTGRLKRGGKTVVELYRKELPTRQHWVLSRLAD